VTAEALLLELERRGLALEAAGEKLRYRGPAGAFTDELRQAAVACRAELLELLSRPRCPRCGRRLDGRGRCWPCLYRRCPRCGRDSGSPIIELCLLCEARALQAGEDLPGGWQP
jgi:hypothetical protein